MARQMTRVAMGTIMGSLLYALVMSLKSDDDEDWIISGSGPRDYDKMRQLMLTGWRPNSLKIGNWVIPYNEWPIAGILSIVGNLHDYDKYDGKTRPEEWADKTAYATLGIAQSFLDRSFLNGVSGVINAINTRNPKWLKRTMASAVTSPVNNNLLRFVNSIYDRNVYQPETIAQQLLSNIPLSPKGAIPQKVTALGTKERKDLPWSRLFGTPAGVSIVVPDEGATREIFQKIRGQGASLSMTDSRELRVDKERRNAPTEKRQYLYLKGKDKETFMIWRGEEYVRLLNENKNLIDGYVKDGEKDELQDLLKTLGGNATREAKRQMVQAYERGELKYQYDTYNKSKEQSDE